MSWEEWVRDSGYGYPHMQLWPDGSIRGGDNKTPTFPVWCVSMCFSAIAPVVWFLLWVGRCAVKAEPSPVGLFVEGIPGWQSFSMWYLLPARYLVTAMRRVIKIEVSRTRNRSRQELAASVLLFYFKFVCVGVLPVVFLCTMFMPGTHGGQRMVKDDCEPQCGCWESNQSLLEEQSVLQLPSFIYIYI